MMMLVLLLANKPGPVNKAQRAVRYILLWIM